ncbi:MAG: HNH endonuclease [Candidatus Shapirobacteria bacterium]
MRSWNKRYAGQICTNKSRSGCKYLNIRINKTCYLLHRVIWKLMHGADPKSMIDHIDGDCFNLRASNLREATNGQNQANGRIQKNNSTGVKGVRLVPSGRFQASIGHDNKAKYLGLFDTKEAAHAAYCKAANELHKEFANYGN